MLIQGKIVSNKKIRGFLKKIKKYFGFFSWLNLRLCVTLSADEVGFADIVTAVSENNAQVCIVFSLFIKCYHVSGIEQLQGVFFF